MITWRENRRLHRIIDTQRPVVDGRACYQVLCSCGRRSVIGPKAVVHGDQKRHRSEAMSDGQAAGTGGS